MTIHQRDLVVLAVHLLGGQTKSLDTEDVAMKAHELGPGRFSWRKYPGQVNLELVRVYLSDAKKPDYGALLDGTGRKGWRLTLKGTEWCEKNAHLLSELSDWKREDGKGGSVDENRWRRERKRLLSSGAWREWKEDGRVSAPRAFALLRLDSYADPAMRDRKLNRLIKLFQSDAEVRDFLNQVAGSTQEGDL